MKISIRLCLVLLTIATDLSSAEELETSTYAQVSPWTIAIDRSMNDGCFLYAEFRRGTFLRIGKNNEDNNLYVFIGDPHWQHIEFGKLYPIQISFGDKEPWHAGAVGVSFDPPDDQPVIGFTVPSDNNTAAYFIYEFMKEKHVEFFHEGISIAWIGLEKSYKAGMKLVECQKSLPRTSGDETS